MARILLKTEIVVNANLPFKSFRGPAPVLQLEHQAPNNPRYGCSDHASTNKIVVLRPTNRSSRTGAAPSPNDRVAQTMFAIQKFYAKSALRLNRLRTRLALEPRSPLGNIQKCLSSFQILSKRPGDSAPARYGAR